MKYVLVLDVPDDRTWTDGDDSVEVAAAFVNRAMATSVDYHLYEGVQVRPLSEVLAC